MRVPASFCGILGYRPSHGTVSMISVLPNSQSLDTVGMIAVDYSLKMLYIIVLYPQFLGVIPPSRGKKKSQPASLIFLEFCLISNFICDENRKLIVNL